MDLYTAYAIEKTKFVPHSIIFIKKKYGVYSEWSLSETNMFFQSFLLFLFFLKYVQLFTVILRFIFF